MADSVSLLLTNDLTNELTRIIQKLLPVLEQVFLLLTSFDRSTGASESQITLGISGNVRPSVTKIISL